MSIESQDSPDVGDRRVRRTRAALFAAARRLVTERRTTEVSVTELADAADVSRRVLYQHFGDRDALLVAAAVDLVAQELVPLMPDDLEESATAMAVVGHFAEHREFYRAMLTGSCAYQTSKTVNSLFRPFSVVSVQQTFDNLDAQAADEVADFLTGATAMALTGWLVEEQESLDPTDFAVRLVRIYSALSGGHAAKQSRPQAKSQRDKS
jgi:AcrR family transcriptional regulator